MKNVKGEVLSPIVDVWTSLGGSSREVKRVCERFIWDNIEVAMGLEKAICVDSVEIWGNFDEDS